MLRELFKKWPSDQCLLCGRSPDVVGIFRPDHPEAWEAPAGKTRFFRYCLCRKCNDLSDKAEQVEEIIRNKLLSGGLAGCRTH